MNELEKLAADLLALPPNSRASLARTLIESLDESADEMLQVGGLTKSEDGMKNCEAEEQRQDPQTKCFVLHVSV